MDHPLHSEKRSDNTQDFTILNIGHALAHTQVIATLERGHLPENLGPYTTNYEYPKKGEVMSIGIGTIKYIVGDEQFETDDIVINNPIYHDEPGNHKAPEDTVQTVRFKAHTKHGIITGEATARRSGLESSFVYEGIVIDNNSNFDEISTPDCRIIEECNDEFE